MKVLAVAMPGVGNFGDDLISVLLAQQIVAQYPKAEVGILHFPGNNPLPYPESDKLQFLEYPELKELKNYRRRKRAIHKFLCDTDYVLVGGGGLIQDSHFPLFIHKFLKFAFHSACKKAKAGLVGIGIGPIKGRYANWYFQQTLSRFSVVQVRDHKSLTYIDTDRHASTISEDIVAGSTHFPAAIRRYDSDTPSLGCSVRPWKTLDFDKIAELIKTICAKRKLSCKLFVFEYERWYNKEYNYALKLKSYLERHNILTTIHCYIKDPWPSFIEAFGSVSCAVAVRYHANILWQKLNIEVLPISYAPKVKSLYEERGGQVLSIDNIDLHKDLDSCFQKVNLTAKYELPDLKTLAFQPQTAKQTIILKTTAVIYTILIILSKLKKELKNINKNFVIKTSTVTSKVYRMYAYSLLKAKNIMHFRF